jgi:hypothetical protein
MGGLAEKCTVPSGSLRSSGLFFIILRISSLYFCEGIKGIVKGCRKMYEGQ